MGRVATTQAPAETDADTDADAALFGWFRDNWAWVAPLIYIYVTLTGMAQSWFQFNAFGINVFEFSELNDFLLAAFREPVSFLAILGLITYGGMGLEDSGAPGGWIENLSLLGLSLIHI